MKQFPSLCSAALLTLGTLHATVSVNYSPTISTTTGVQVRVTTTEKVGGSFVNHNYYPGPAGPSGNGLWAGGAQASSVYVDNNNDGRGTFSGEASFDATGQLTLKAMASVGPGGGSGWVEFLVAQTITNTSPDTIIRTFDSYLHANITQNGFETGASGEVWAFAYDSTFYLDDPYTLVSSFTVKKGIDDQEWFSEGDARQILELYSDGPDQTDTGSQTLELVPGESIHLLATMRFAADEPGSQVNALNTFSLTVDNPAGLSFDGVPEPSLSLLAGMSACLLIARRRRS